MHVFPCIVVSRLPQPQHLSTSFTLHLPSLLTPHPAPPAAPPAPPQAFGFVSAPHQWVSRKDEGDKVIVVERGELICCFS